MSEGESKPNPAVNVIPGTEGRGEKLIEKLMEGPVVSSQEIGPTVLNTAALSRVDLSLPENQQAFVEAIGDVLPPPSSLPEGDSMLFAPFANFLTRNQLVERLRQTTIADAFRGSHGKRFYGTEDPLLCHYGMTSVDILSELVGKKLGDYVIARLRSYSPVALRISRGEVTCDACQGRVTIYVDENDVITGIEQETTVWGGACGADADAAYQKILDGQNRPDGELPAAVPVSPALPSRPQFPQEAFGEKVDLSLTAQRLRMKADGARWAAERRRRLTAASDYDTTVAPTDREIISRAKAIPCCYLWTNGPNCPTPDDLSAFDVLAECYDNAAAAAELVCRLLEAEMPWGSTEMLQAFRLLAEAQSALRVAAMRAEGPEDSDQFELYQWLKLHTKTKEIYVARHMRVGDPADPGNREDLAKRIAEAGAS